MANIIILLASLVSCSLTQQCASIYNMASNHTTLSYTGVTDLITPVTNIKIYTDGTYIWRFQVNSGKLVPDYSSTLSGASVVCATPGALVTGASPNPLTLGTGD